MPIIPESLKENQIQRPMTLGEYRLLRNPQYQTTTTTEETTTSEEDKKAQEDYQKALDEYNSQKANYEYQLNQYNTQLKYFNLAQKLYSNAKKGINPYINQQIPAVRKYYDRLVKAEASIKYAYENGKLTQKELLKYYGITEPDFKNIPTAPEGYQGISTTEGVKFQKIPETKIQPKVNPLLYNPLGIQFPNQNIQTRYINPTISANMNIPKKETISNEPDIQLFSKDIGTYKYNQENDIIYQGTKIISEGVSEVLNTIAGVPTERDYTTRDLFSLVPRQDKYPRKETITYEPPKLPTQAEIKKQNIIKNSILANEYGNLAVETSDMVINKYQTKLNNELDGIQNLKGNDYWIELDKIIKKNRDEAKVEIDRRIESINKNFKGQIEQQQKLDVQTYLQKEYTEKFWNRRVADVLRFGVYYTPVLGQGLLFSDIAQTGYNLPSTISSLPELVKYPELGKEAAGSLIVYLAGGMVVGKYEGVKRQKEIDFAMKEAKYIIDSKGYLTEKEIMNLKIGEDMKQKLIAYMKEGKSVRSYEISTKAKEGLESKTPKIKGEFVEVIDQYGNIIVRKLTGTLEAELNGKKIKTEYIGAALLKLEESSGKVEGISELIQRQKVKPVIGIKGEKTLPKDKLVFSRFTEESKITKYKQVGKTREIESESTTGILLRKKYQGEYLLEPYGIYEGKILLTPEMESLLKQSKKVSKSRAIERQTLTKQIKPSGYLETNPLTGESTGTFQQRQKFNLKGKSILEFIKEKTTKQGKDFNFKSEDINPSKSSPKNKMRILSKEGGGENIFSINEGIMPSEYGGKQFLIPYAGEEAVYTFGESLPRELSRGGTIKGFIEEGKYGLVGGVYTMDLISLGVSDINSNKNISLSANVLNTDLINQNKTKTKEQDLVQEGLFTIQKPENTFKFLQVPISKLAESQEQKLKQELIYKQDTTSRTPSLTFGFNFTFPDETRTEIPKIPKKEKGLNKKNEAYVPEAFIQATKPRKSYWKRLDNRPLTKQSALSESARFVDNTISARGRIVKVKTNKEPIDTKDNYFLANIQKFRGFMQRKGVRTKLPNSFIERAKYRADKSGETKALQSSRRTPFGF